MYKVRASVVKNDDNLPFGHIYFVNEEMPKYLNLDTVNNPPILIHYHHHADGSKIIGKKKIFIAERDAVTQKIIRKRCTATGMREKSSKNTKYAIARNSKSVIVYEYDANNTLMKTTRFEYNDKNKLVNASCIKKSKEIYFNYEELGNIRVTQVLKDSKGNTIASGWFVYNAEGKLIDSRREKITYDYSDENKLLGKNTRYFNNGAQLFKSKNVQYAVDQKTEINSKEIYYQFEWNAKGKPIRETRCGTNRNISYYDINGQFHQSARQLFTKIEIEYDSDKVTIISRTLTDYYYNEQGYFTSACEFKKNAENENISITNINSKGEWTSRTRYEYNTDKLLTNVVTIQFSEGNKPISGDEITYKYENNIRTLYHSSFTFDINNQRIRSDNFISSDNAGDKTVSNKEEPAQSLLIDMISDMQDSSKIEINIIMSNVHGLNNLFIPLLWPI